MAARAALFYHIWAPQGCYPWTLLVDEQLKRIYRSSLPDHADIYCCISGPEAEKVARLVLLYKWVKLVGKADENHEYEGYTLKHLYDVAQQGRHDAFGYIHTKGLSHARPDGDPKIYRNTNSWRHMMESVIIDRWRDAIEKLEIYEVAGANFRSNPWPHFSGNFWWATANYVKTLPHPMLGVFPETDAFNDNPNLKNRTNFERWLGINKPKAYDFYSQPLRFHGKKLTVTDDFDLLLDDVGPYYLSNLR